MADPVFYAPRPNSRYPAGRLNKQNALVVSNVADTGTPWLPINAGDAIRIEVHRCNLTLNQTLKDRTGQDHYDIETVAVEPAATVVLETKFGGDADSAAVPVEKFINQQQSRLFKNIPGGYVRLRIDCTNKDGMAENLVRMFVNISRREGR